MITISTNLLEALTRWALPEDTMRPHLAQVRFRDNEAIACDGVRFVRVPLDTAGHDFGIWRADALAAIAAQDARVHADKSIAIRRRETRQLGIEPIKQGCLRVRLDETEAPALIVRAHSVGDFPTRDMLDGCMRQSSERAPSPDGFAFDPRFIADVHEVVLAMNSRAPVKIVRWGCPTDPVTMEGPAGVRFVVMPMMQGW